MNNFNVFGKIVFMLFSLLFPYFIYGQTNVVLDKLTTLESYLKVYDANVFDHSNQYLRSNDKGVWNGIPLKEVYFYDEYFSSSIDTSVKNSANKLVAYLEQTYGDNLIVDQGYYRRNYAVTTRAVEINVYLDLKEDDSMTEDTGGTLSVSFTKVIDNPLANLSEELQSNKEGISYELVIVCENVLPTILVNGIPILAKMEKGKYSLNKAIELNKYILDKETPIDLSFTFTPGIDENGKLMTTIPKKSSIEIALEYVNAKGNVTKSVQLYDNSAYVTDTIVKNGETRYSTYYGTNEYGMKEVLFNHQFKAPVDYKLAGWSNGKDLCKEVNLEQRIKQFYADYAALILNKDINNITQLLYSSFLEKYTYNYNNTEQKSYHDYEDLEYMLQNIFKVVTAKDTKLHISNNGQLAYLEAMDKTSYLKAVGIDYIENISFMFFIDKNTNELKIIR
ncbi:hypothetical protein [Myroides sp.]|uniref:hypothetical protein n=1 Tax=Myroides sp. TaxID=1874736 RepID=UPI003F39785D